MQDGCLGRKKRLFGLVAIGSLLVLGAIVHMAAIANFESYKYCVSYLPPEWISARYAVSWAQRFLGLIAGAGLIDHRRWAAKLAILLSVLNMVTVYWKYPYKSFEIQSLVWDQRWGNMFAAWGYPQVHFSSYVLPAVMAAYVLDIVFFGYVLYYLTRPQVKAHLI